MKHPIFLITLIAGITTIISQGVLAQTTQNNTQTVLPQSTVITDLLQQRGISTGVELVFESPTTVIFKGDIGPNATLAFAIDTAKENGYSIDAVTVYTPTPRAEGSPEDVYTVFMSK
jgi:hypothetical protein